MIVAAKASPIEELAKVAPIVTWIICGIGLHEAKYFQNESAKKKNMRYIIFSMIVFILFLVIYMLVKN